MREETRRRGRQPEFWRCCTPAEGELPRTRGPNPLFWTHTPASSALSLSLSLSLTISFSSLRPNHLQPSLLAPPRSTYYYRCCLSCLRLPPLQPLLHPPPERQTRHIARSVALLPSEAPRRSILYNYPACITKVAAKLFLPFRATLQCHLLQHRPTSLSAHSSPTVRLTPSFSLSLSLFSSPALFARFVFQLFFTIFPWTSVQAWYRTKESGRFSFHFSLNYRIFEKLVKIIL